MADKEESNGSWRMISTKFRPPQLRTDVVSRPRLVNRINDNIQKGVLLISAPAGFGKTTLAAAWAAQVRLPVIWISLDENDNSPQAFMQTIHYALQKALPDSPFNEINLFSQLNQPVSFEKRAFEFIKQTETTAGEFVIVLDNLHFITDDAMAQIFTFMIDNLPPNLHFILISRIDPNIPIARLRAKNMLEEIRVVDLRFTHQECSRFLSQCMGLDLAKDDIDILCKRCEGWVTGLQLAAISLQHKQTATEVSGLISGENTYVLDFLVEEVFEQQPKEIQNFLLCTSILENLTGSLCEALMQDDFYQDHGEEILHHLYHRNLFITALDNREHWFRYHPLFAESLQHLLAEKTPGQIPDLHRLASQWYMENSLPKYAIRHALKIKDYQVMTTILEQQAESLIYSDGILTVLNWIDIIPDEYIRTKPNLCIMYAWGLIISFEIKAAEYWLDNAKSSLHIPNNVASLDPSIIKQMGTEEINMLGQILAIQSMLAAQQGEAQEASCLNQRAMGLLPEDNILLQNYMLMERCVTTLFDMELANLDSLIKEFIETSRASGNWLLTIIGHTFRGRTQFMRGELSKAWNTYTQSIQFTIDTYGKIMPLVGYIYSEMGAILLERNEINEAMSYISRGIETSRDWFPAIFTLQAYTKMAYLKQVMGDMQGAQNEIEFAHHLANSTNNEYDDLLVSIQETKLELYKGNWRHCLNWAQRNGFLERQPDKTNERMLFSLVTFIHINLARMWLWRCRSEKQTDYARRSLEILQELLVAIENRHIQQIKIELLTLQALVYQELDDNHKALFSLQEAIKIGEPEGFRRVFLDEGVYFARLAARLLARIKKNGNLDIFPTQEYLLDLLSSFSDTQDFEYPGDDSDDDLAKTAAKDGKKSEDFIIDMLTPREKEVLQLVARGATNAEIGRELFLALNTVKRHLNNIFLKLGANTRTQAVAIARKLDIID